MALDLLVVPGDGIRLPGYVRLAYCVPKTMLERSLPRFRQLADQYGLKNKRLAERRRPLLSISSGAHSRWLPFQGPIPPIGKCPERDKRGQGTLSAKLTEGCSRFA